MELGKIFFVEEYNNVVNYLMNNITNMTIEEIEPNSEGKRQFKLVEIPPLSVVAQAKQELDTLTNWFNTEYTKLEQKYRRLYALKLYTDNGYNPYDELLALYETAERKRRRIQELEVIING